MEEKHLKKKDSRLGVRIVCAAIAGVMALTLVGGLVMQVMYL